MMKRLTKHDHQHTNTTFFLLDGGGSIIMAAIAFALVGFMAGLFTMTVISLYKYVLKKMSV
jgi:hypothetical protein